MKKSTIDERIAKAEAAVDGARRRLADLRRRRPPEEFADHVLAGPGGAKVHLSDLFGGARDLILVHNMGSSCPYCTLWADGFNGVLPHLVSRAAFALVTPDTPAAQRRFAEKRGWKFRLFSDRTGALRKAAGYADADGSPLPGVSAFRREDDGRILRTGHAPFGPGDPFCGVFHLFDLLADGPADFAPRFRY